MHILYIYHILLLVGIAAAVLLSKHKACWLAYLIGAGVEGCLIWEEYSFLARAGYGYAMSGVIGKFFLIAVVGAIVVKIFRNRQIAKAEAERAVLFFCPTCKSIREGAPGKIQGCPNCHKRTEQKDIRWKEWQKLTQEAQRMMTDSWVGASAPVLDPEATVPSRDVARSGPASVILELRTGPMAGGRFRCRENKPVFIGRDQSRCNLVLNGYGAVSGLHCRVDVTGRGVTVTDLGSSYGTFLGNAPLEANRPAAVPDGAELRLATADCIFRICYE